MPKEKLRYTSFTMLARPIAYFFVGLIHAVGPIVIFAAIFSSIPTAEFVSSSLTADGTIIGFNRVYLPRRSKDVYRPVFRFTANDGQSHMITAASATALVPFKRGDHLRVIYLKDHPETARIDTIPQLWMPQIILTFIGAVFILFSVRILTRRRDFRRVAVTG